MRPKAEPFLSKSKYIAGLQCPKLLWMHYHAQDQFPPTDPETQAIFDQGHQVTRLFQKLFPDGVEIEGADDFDKIVQETQSALTLRKPLFEAGFRHKSTYARPDVLVPQKNGSWDLYEVKSSSHVKDIHYEDVAFQKYCYEGAGIKIRKVYLVRVNNKYVKNGVIDPAGLLASEDITDHANELSAHVENRVNEMLRVLKEKKCPEVSIGLQCSKPYDCQLQPFCWQHVPEDSVFVLNKIRKDKAFGFINSGCVRVNDVSPNQLTTTSHQIVRKCHVENKAHIDQAAVRSFVEKLEFPVHFIDFETVSPAVPFYDGTRPFQKIPFQFSLHILSAPGKEPKHHAFLAEGSDDPRNEFLKRLSDLIGPKGSIVAYNLSFERRLIQESVEAQPEYGAWFKKIERRLVDLMTPFQKFDYYDPKQMGRYSIKSVYPALIGGSYHGMTISDGGQASREYGRVTFSEGVAGEDREQVYAGLLEYCKLDTSAMIDVLNVLRTAAGS